MAEDCIFCKIANREIPSNFVYEDDQVVAFKDLNPIAPVHILIVPKDHKLNLSEYKAEDESLLGHVLTVAAHIAREQGIDESGYRVITNAGPDAGQTVMHTHFHLLGGRKLGFDKQ
ncbi:MAG: histidine triad nucleotide-binding protein [Anaerolineaceae bacterium]|nr:histidine triad nucleotide-binding protein [Anaerolineaceae bacterium]